MFAAIPWIVDRVVSAEHDVRLAQVLLPRAHVDRRQRAERGLHLAKSSHWLFLLVAVRNEIRDRFAVSCHHEAVSFHDLPYHLRVVVTELSLADLA